MVIRRRTGYEYESLDDCSRCLLFGSSVCLVEGRMSLQAARAVYVFVWPANVRRSYTVTTRAACLYLSSLHAAATKGWDEQLPQCALYQWLL